MNKEYQFNVSDDLKCTQGSLAFDTTTHLFLETPYPVGFLDALLTQFFHMLNSIKYFPFLSYRDTEMNDTILSLKN